jgi:hypothetical protein
MPMHGKLGDDFDQSKHRQLQTCVWNVRLNDDILSLKNHISLWCQHERLIVQLLDSNFRHSHSTVVHVHICQFNFISNFPQLYV